MPIDFEYLKSLYSLPRDIHNRVQVTDERNVPYAEEISGEESPFSTSRNWWRNKPSDGRIVGLNKPSLEHHDVQHAMWLLKDIGVFPYGCVLYLLGGGMDAPNAIPSGSTVSEWSGCTDGVSSHTFFVTHHLRPDK